jgi:hypothetical protein
MPLEIRSMTRPAIALALGMLLLAGCVASHSALLPSQQSNAMAGGLQKHDLLYVTNESGTVSVYRYWQHTLAFILTDFKKPMGACADRSGHVYVTDYGRQKIYEYAHGGRKPIATLDDSPYKPFTCSVSPPNGDLAVANSPYGTYGTGGNIAIYPHAGGKPIILTGSGGSDGTHFTGCAYDDHGDLLAMNQYRYDPFWYSGFYYLPKNGTKLLPMSLPGMGYGSSHFGVVQGVAWDGKYWLVGPSYNYIILYTIDVKASEVGTLKLNNGQPPFFGPAAIYRKALKSQGTQLVAGTGSYGSGTVDFFKYPAAGGPIAQISKDLDAPFGVAISLRTQP